MTPRLRAAAALTVLLMGTPPAAAVAAPPAAQSVLLVPSFSPAFLPAGGISILTYTAVATAPTATAWRVTETLPPGLHVAVPPAGRGSCADARIVTAATLILAGLLPAGRPSCALSVLVTGPAGTYSVTSADTVAAVGARPVDRLASVDFLPVPAALPAVPTKPPVPGIPAVPAKPAR